MSNFNLDMLTEGIRARHLGTQNKQLVEKWNRTGLLRGLENTKRENMARMLENQAGQVLREASSASTGNAALASSGDLRGFTNIAFPIVRRVFGGLIANDLVSIQPMSLPSGLLFYLDYTYAGALAGDTGMGGSPYNSGSSIYNDPAGKGVRSGSLGVGGQYDLAGSGYSRVWNNVDVTLLASGAVGNNTGKTINATLTMVVTGADGKNLQFDPQLETSILANTGGADGTAGGQTGSSIYTSVIVSLTESTDFDNADLSLVKEFSIPAVAPYLAVGNDMNGKALQGGTTANLRRLNQIGTYTADNGFTPDPLVTTQTANAALLLICSGVNGGDGGAVAAATMNMTFPISAQLNTGTGDTLVIPAFESNFGVGTNGAKPEIPEIDIKVESVAVVAETRKLRARWSPELAQDLNAYHSLDAEVELTQILSEQIALELDREILNDLLTQAGAATYYWSRSPGKFVNKTNGSEISRGDSLKPGPNFTGTVREWYETLIETIIDVANEIHRKTLRGSANFVVVGPDVATILEASVYFKPAFTLDGDGQVSGLTIGADKVGTLSNRFTVYKDPYFPRNKVLVGYKGGSYLETGYVYAPYVPLIVTPTIFAPEDFTPRKGVMTRYGKKMVRSDFYGTVTCMDMNVI